MILRGYKWTGEMLSSFPRPFGGELVGEGGWYWEVVILDFPIRSVEEMGFLSPVDISY